MSIHPSAVISPEAKISPEVMIGPYVVIDGRVSIGHGCIIHSGAKLLGRLTLGARNVVHSTAVLGDWPQDRKYKGEPSEVLIGDDNVFREGVTVHRGTGLNSRTVIGNRCYFMVNSHVGHNCVVQDDVTLVNGALLGGHVHVAERAIIGGNTAVHQFCRVGRLAMLSNACCMNVDVPPFFIAMATNTLTQLNAVGLRRSGMPKESINAIRKMFQLAFRDMRGLSLSHTLENLPPDILHVPEVQEVIAFCKSSKRGIAKFQAWSDRNISRPAESEEE
ncbi:MAG TPA: acyl-ACP--UDP-N-acetylglucosamine O-acyltransferase [Phycisphaerae bacterium]|nr:acyl-ACP--UDP-N-acetylglucosamine O-acyltransferase [Phycisphaerae bacterium]